MVNELIFDGSNSFQVISAARIDRKVIVDVVSTQAGSVCPRCSGRSSRIHSYYYRTMLDLPMLGNETWIRLKARKFYCRNDGCDVKVFTERFNSHFDRGKRMTLKVFEKVLKVALLMGGEGGKKICQLMSLPVSSSTLLRSIHDKEVPDVEALQVIGLDDWAYRKGVTYGTVLVDLEKQKIFDLLPDREADTVEKWLKKHPGIKIVSRDRYSNYATGSSKALPEAQQVADRWHLIKNLGDAVKKVLERTQGTLKQKANLAYMQESCGPEKKPSRILSVKTQLALEKKQKLMDEVKQMFKQGVGIRAISRTLHINRATVRNYLQMGVALPKNQSSRAKVFLFEEYIRNAIATRPGVMIKDLYEEIKAMGYEGKTTMAYENIGRYMPKREKVIYPKDWPRVYWRPAQVSLLLYRKVNELHGKDSNLINSLIKESLEIETCHQLFQRFREMLEQKDRESLNKWVEDAMTTSIKELQSFGKGGERFLGCSKCSKPSMEQWSG